MMQDWQYVICGVLLLGLAIQNPVAGQETPSTKAPSRIYLTVTGKGDSPPAPTLSQLNASIDNQPAQIASVRSVDRDKLLFAVLVDISGSDAAAASEIKQAAIELFQGLLAEGNEGHLVVFNAQIAMSTEPVSVSEVRRKLDSIQFRGGSALYDAIGETCTKILSRKENPEFPRRAIFLISDGFDNHVARAEPKSLYPGFPMSGKLVSAISAKTSRWPNPIRMICV